MACFTINGRDPEGPVLILAHGAGAPADSPFMAELAGVLGERGITTVRFEFPYMTKRRSDGKKRPPDRQPVLLKAFEEVIERTAAEPSLANRPLFIGGKSMGGRMASLLAAESSAKSQFRGVLCFGYPFHPPGKPDRWRTGHFSEFQCPVLIVQGTRDPFGKRPEVEAELADRQAPELAWLEGGDHDFKPLARQPEGQLDLLQRAATLAASFILEVTR